MDNLSPDTTAAHAGGRFDPVTGAVMPAIQPSTSYARGEDYDLISSHGYSREGHPVAERVESVAADLDGGVDALAFGSGMAAAVSLFETVATGRHIVAPRIMYHGIQNWLRRLEEHRGIGLTLFDQSDPAALAAAIIPGRTDVVWIESPVNPTWDVIDIAAAAVATHAAGASLVVDSTVAPPVTTRPLGLGADFVFHSASKYYNGHSDVLAGLLVARDTDARWAEAGLVRTAIGGILPPFEGWLLLRGMRTMPMRFRRASESALKIARFLEAHALVESVLYPGLPTHPGNDVAVRQMTGGFGGMLSVLVAGGADGAKKVATSTRLIVPTTSLGGVESVIEHRATVEGPNSIVPANLLRLSVGIEDPDDLIADLEQALS